MYDTGFIMYYVSSLEWRDPVGGPEPCNFGVSNTPPVVNRPDLVAFKVISERSQGRLEVPQGGASPAMAPVSCVNFPK